MADRVLRSVAARQTRRRVFNDRLTQLDDASSDDETRLFRCECGLIGCAATVKLSLDDYAAIRGTPRQFVVRADHLIPEAERLVATRRGHAVIEKFEDFPLAPTLTNAKSVARPQG